MTEEEAFTIADHKTPADIISDMVQERLTATVSP